MSQPKFQLETFRSWAGKSSDISYYLNSHHVDYLVDVMRNNGKALSVVAVGANGFANKLLQVETEDTITLLIDWENKDKSKGIAVFTSSWIAPVADVHTHQGFFFLGQKGQIKIDQ